MSRGNKRDNTERPNPRMQKVIEAEFTPIPEPEAPVSVPTDPTELLNLEDVAFMVVVGRKRDGKPFFHTVSLPDFFAADGLLDFAKRKLDRAYDEFFDNEDVK
jgi:hypothetical protein